MTVSVKARVMAVHRVLREASTSRVRNGTQEHLGFSKNIKKSSPLIIGNKGQMLA
jgi:hypothetical protein